MIIRTRVVFCSLFAISLLGLSQTPANSPPPPSQIKLAHGTVNVFLGTGRDFVVVTDSMLTFAGNQHTPTGLKLYKLDEKTIAAMAGLYSEPGAQDLAELSLYLPSVIADLERRRSLHGFAENFTLRAKDIFETFQFQMSNHLQALVSSDASTQVGSQQIIELTIVGYDEDGSVKVAELTMIPRRTEQGVDFATIDRPHSAKIPICEQTTETQKMPLFPYGDYFFTIRSVGKGLFCDVAGIPEVAEAVLANPDLYLPNPNLQLYAASLKTNQPLTAPELRSLAVDLEDRTAFSEMLNRQLRVGGNAEVAVLSDGKIIEDPPPLNAPDIGKGLHGNKYSAGHVSCRPEIDLPGIAVGRRAAIVEAPFAQVQIQVEKCAVYLDQLVFHDSIFEDSTLIYMGSKGTVFANTNQVINSDLVLGPTVSLSDPMVQRLMCGFPWESMSQYEKPIPIVCSKP
jgi:hypothetical protein